MSSAADTQSKKEEKKKKKKSQPIRVAIRCSWSGARLAVPSSAAAAGTSPAPPVTLTSTIESILQSVNAGSSLPASIFEPASDSSVVYLRNRVPRSEWTSTTLRDLGVDVCDGGSGVILTLNLSGGGGSGGTGGGGGGAAAVAAAPASAPVQAAAASAAAPAPSCAACGKTGDGLGLKTCTACESVKYCNVDCQRAHRKVHKKECKRKEKELKLCASLSSDVEALKISGTPKDTSDDPDLFLHPKRDACPICMLALPLNESEIVYQGCCGQQLCEVCAQEQTRVITAKNRKRLLADPPLPTMPFCCAFCRKKQLDSLHGVSKALQERLETNPNDGEGWYNMASYCKHGYYGVPKNERKAYELFQRAADLGQREACNMVADQYLDLGIYSEGRFIKKDVTKGMFYLKESAKGGFLGARHNLGVVEALDGNSTTAARHWMISAAAGCKGSVDSIKTEFEAGRVGKDVYAAALRAYQDAVEEEKIIKKERARVAAKSIMRLLGPRT